MVTKGIIDKLYEKNYLNEEEMLYLLDNIDEENKEYLRVKALNVRTKYYGKKVYLRGLIEFTNYCKNNCMYCGIRFSNKNAIRYRLNAEEILSTCRKGYELGFRTFVLQGGEDPYFSDDIIIDIISKIKNYFPSCAVTLSIGEKSYDSYKRYFDAGADRYLLRHETASKKLYESLHPNMSFENRIKCLNNLKKIGYQVGAGFMIGLPNQTNEDFVKDLMFLKELEPQMVGIGPFIPHKDTPLSDKKAGDLNTTLILLSIIRLLLPKVLLPSTTALGTINPKGRELGLLAGANVVMPNLSPIEVREKYSLYDGKICTGEEAAECLICLKNRIESVGFEVDMGRGDNIDWERKS
ncbi:MAG: [FeFe] hydrogenase H-cluster radical SAM maturase HydE [Caloramator sp.]|nr:[FeFe] hydrogenase H-cluster radical SAM maturase HydE [Caloramator sp.]